MPATYEPIATTTLGSAAASITFSSIASTYTDLRIVLVPTTSGGSGIRLRLNSDTATNYSRTYLQGDGATASSSTSATQSSINAPIATSTTIPMMISYDLFSYAGSTNKTLLATYNGDLNGSGSVAYQVALWRSTSAITAIELYVPSGTMSIGTTATLYGIKNA